MTDQKNINEERIRVLRDRFTWLKIRLEATAHQIEVLGGGLNPGEAKFLKTLEKHSYKLSKKHLSEHEWIDKVIDMMEQMHYPSSIKEIAEALYLHQDLLFQSGVYNNVRKAVNSMVQNGMASKSLTEYKKYTLNIGFKQD